MAKYMERCYQKFTYVLLVKFSQLIRVYRIQIFPSVGVLFSFDSPYTMFKEETTGELDMPFCKT